MKRIRLLLPGLVVLLALGLLAGVALAAPQRAADDTTTTAPTDTTTTDTTTTDPATTDTTTADTTTTDTTASTGTTPATTVDQTTTDSGGDAGSTTGTTTTPVAPCDTTQITCGNNAATQVAVVSQNCTAVQQNSVLTIDVQTLDGKPVDNFTVQNNTTCLNTLAITQVVQQFCVGCTVVVIPPPSVTNIYVAASSPPAPPPAPVRVGYCMPYSVKHGDGTLSPLVMLDKGQPDWDPAYVLAVPAPFSPATGYSCPAGPIDQPVPTFTLTVPISFVGQSLRLCLQPASASAAPICHDIRIDNGATISVPVSQSLSASVIPKAAPAAKSAKKIAAATALFHSATTKHAKAKPHVKKKTKKGARS